MLTFHAAFLLSSSRTDIREWLDPMLKAWFWDYVRARSLPGQEVPKPDPYVPRYNNPGATAEGED